MVIDTKVVHKSVSKSTKVVHKSVRTNTKVVHKSVNLLYISFIFCTFTSRIIKSRNAVSAGYICGYRTEGGSTDHR